jgi:hypothetical protein
MPSGAQNIKTNDVTNDETRSIIVSTANTRVLRFHSGGTELAGTEFAGTEFAGTEFAGTELAGTEFAGIEFAGTTG